MAGQYGDYSEIMTTKETAELLSTSKDKVFEWIRAGKIEEIGVELKYQYHYFKQGRDYRFIKDRMCELFGILPKHIIQINEVKQ